MLSLERKAGESIFIGDEIEVTVVRIGRTYVRLGITAPKDVPIVRDDAIDTAAKPQEGDE